MDNQINGTISLIDKSFYLGNKAFGDADRSIGTSLTMRIKYKPEQHRINVKGVPCQHVRINEQFNEHGAFITCLDCRENWNI